MANKTCPTCGGKGFVTRAGFVWGQEHVDCKRCGGSGMIPTNED